MKLSVIVTAHDKERYMDVFLHNLRRLEPDAELILIDDGSHDDTGEIMRRWADVFIRTEDIWEVKANNVGLRTATGDYVAIVQDDDFIVAEAWLTTLANFMTDNRISILSGRGTGHVYFRSVEDVSQCRVAAPPPAQGAIQKFPEGLYRLNLFLPRSNTPTIPVWRCDETIRSPLIFSRGVIDDIGLLDESYSPAFMDDHDYCWRARQRGHLVAFTSLPLLPRFCGGTLDRGNGAKKVFMDAAEKASYQTFLDRHGQSFPALAPAAMSPLGTIAIKVDPFSLHAAHTEALLSSLEREPPLTPGG